MVESGNDEMIFEKTCVFIDNLSWYGICIFYCSFIVNASIFIVYDRKYFFKISYLFFMKPKINIFRNDRLDDLFQCFFFFFFSLCYNNARIGSSRDKLFYKWLYLCKYYLTHLKWIEMLCMYSLMFKKLFKGKCVDGDDDKIFMM